MPTIKLLSFNAPNKWYSRQLNELRDTLLINIKNESVKRLNDMRLEITYTDINQHNDTVTFSEKLDIKIDKSEDSSPMSAEEKTLTLDKPIPFVITQDSALIRKYHISADFKADESYSLVVDSAATNDIYNKANDTVKFDFQVFNSENFATLSVKLKNVAQALGLGETEDTTQQYKLSEGSLMLLIYDQNNNIYKIKSLTCDEMPSDSTFLGGSYSLKIYYDQNGNKKWDGGNYLRHRQPEKVFILDSPITLSENSEQTIIWNLLTNQEEASQTEEAETTTETDETDEEPSEN